MDYKVCPHYSEILSLIAEGRDLEDISFEIDDTKNCVECIKIQGACMLWITLGFVEDMKPQMGIEDAKVTIDTLDKQMEKIVLRLLSNLKGNSDLRS